MRNLVELDCFHSAIKGQYYHDIETNQLIYHLNQMSGFQMMTTLVFDGLTKQKPLVKVIQRPLKWIQ